MPEDNTQTTDNNTTMPTSAPVSDTNFGTPAPASSAIPDPTVPPVVDSPVVTPDGPLADALEAASSKAPEDGIVAEVASKIAEAQNILIALSSDPSVDEISAAIGLSLYLDKLDKRATAIYSGTTPNALEFLKPEETFESTADTLQDFVIALNKDKADHLRYKLDGDFVKIYITPYKSRIAKEDLEFSYGDFNIDLVIALDVANGIDLDSALREHGRIMHDAVIVNITTGNPGKLGEIEWSDKEASSVSEMAAKLLYGIKSDVEIGPEEATAFLTGIVAATDRFSNASTTSDTMRISAKLMESGANQQLIAENITPEVENELMSYATVPAKKKTESTDPTNLEIEHDGEESIPKESSEGKSADDAPTETLAESPIEPAETATETITEAPAEEAKVEPESPSTSDISSMDEDLQAAAASLAGAGAETTPLTTESPIRIEEPAPEAPSDSLSAAPTELPQVNLPPIDLPAPVVSENMSSIASSEPMEDQGTAQAEKVIEPSSDFLSETPAPSENKYGQMLEAALAEAGDSATPTTPIMTTPEEAAPAASADAMSQPVSGPSVANPAASVAPAVPSAPEINGVPEINYMPLPDDEVLPPPPAPPVDLDNAGTMEMPAMPEPVAPAAPAAPTAPTEVANPMDMGGHPIMQDQVYTEQASNPSAFQIPGM